MYSFTYKGFIYSSLEIKTTINYILKRDKYDSDLYDSNYQYSIDEKEVALFCLAPHFHQLMPLQDLLDAFKEYKYGTKIQCGNCKYFKKLVNTPETWGDCTYFNDENKHPFIDLPHWSYKIINESGTLSPNETNCKAFRLKDKK